ncbi:MAG: LamG-like jellyroll fold domain-containing protein, partial [Bacteroidales bacterium]|nr:LamG-like jellyroll fold domain-containing protein [Bacteroidales bacterium]
TDSLLSFHASHFIAHFSGDTFYYVTDPIVDEYQYLQQSVVLNNVISENSYPIGFDVSPMDHVIPTNHKSGKSQFLYLASELIGAGMSAGEIDALQMNAYNTADAGFLRVRMKNITENELDPAFPELDGLTEVYFSDYSFVAGYNRIQFYQPFNWDGASNILVEFSFTNEEAGTALEVGGEHIVGFTRSIFSTDGTHIVNDVGYTSVPAGPMSAISNELTLSFWCYGNPDFMPANTSIVYGNDINGQRALNIHLPWGNSSVYFDCGYSNGGYDRINKAASPEELEGRWNHWAFTKNAATGDMKIFLNGSLWHYGTGKTRTIDLQDFIIGTLNYSQTRNYYGKIDEFRVWSRELDSASINQWMHTNLDNTHPHYADLVAYYKFDEGAGNAPVDSSPNGETAEIHDYVMWGKDRGEQLNRNFIASSQLPQIEFFSGDYDLTITDEIITEQEERIANYVLTYEIIPRWGTQLDDSINIVSEELVWESGYAYVYDPEGNRIDSTEIVPTDNIVITQLEYYRRFIGKIELMSFVTPYGINLDLGEDGKTWYFDMSDYVDVLKGSKRLTVELGGQRQEDMDIKFWFIVGTPPHDVIDFKQLWRPASSSYQDLLADRNFEPREVTIHPDAEQLKLRSVITGHGQEGEFIGRQHTFNIDGDDAEYQWFVWTECSTIPIYPQGGTWLYDRAGWCPGDPSDLYEYDITEYVTPGQNHTLDYGIVNGSGTSNYQVSQQLVSYGTPNFTLDAAIIGINKPNATAAHERFNPACTDPVVIIKNTGSTTLTSLELEFYVVGGTALTQTWSGSLGFLDTAEVILEVPNFAFWQENSNRFTVNIINANGQVDEYPHNNTYTSTFESVDLLDINLTPVTIQCYTNQQGWQTSYTLTDLEGNVLLERDNLESTTQYSDVVELGLGCYRLRIDDSGDNGLYYWHQPNYGSGYFRMRDVNDDIVESFEREFGRFAVYEFAVVDMTGTAEAAVRDNVISIYPNPTRNSVNILHQGMENTHVEVTVLTTAMLKVRENSYVVGPGDYLESIDLSGLPAGLYFLQLKYNDRVIVKKVIKQ